MAEPIPRPQAAPPVLPAPTIAAPVMADPFAAARRDLFDSLSDEFLHNYGKGRTLLAVDGADRSGTTAFADALATRLSRGGHAVFRASLGNFHRSREEINARGEDSAEGFYRHSCDYDLFRRVLVGPFRMGGSTGFVTAAFDVERNAQVEMDWETGPKDATLVVDGAFLNRPELRGLWNFSIWLEVPDVILGSQRLEAAQTLYEAESGPRTRATAIVDNSHPELPRRVFADSC